MSLSDVHNRDTYQERVSQYVFSEFDDIFNYISLEGSTHLSLTSEAKLLLAVLTELPHRLYIPEESVHQLLLVKSYLVHVDDPVPKLYLPLSRPQIQHFIRKFTNTHQSAFPRTSNVNVINDAFENTIPSVILPQYVYQLRRGTESKTISLKFQSIPLILPQANPAKDILYQTGPYCKGTDFVAVKDDVFGSDEQDKRGEYLIAIQVTAINTGIKKKFESTINISPTFTEGKNVLLIMIALNFQDFDGNYGTFTEVTSSPSPTVKARYESWKKKGGARLPAYGRGRGY